MKLVTNERLSSSRVRDDRSCAARRDDDSITLAETDFGTNVLTVHDGLPRSLPTADNEAGGQEALAKPAALVEEG